MRFLIIFNFTGSSLPWLETNKMDCNLIGVSVSNLNSKDITIGASAVALETNKADRNLVDVNVSNLGNSVEVLVQVPSH